MHGAGRRELSSPLASLTETQRVRRQQRRFIKDEASPDEALRWFTLKQRDKALCMWRQANGKLFAEHGRCLRIAWTLEWLFGKNGYAFPTDAFLSQALDIPIKKIQSGLHALEKRGAIIRASVFVNGRVQRRIWPSRANIPPTVGNTDTPHGGSNIPPTVGRQNTQEGKPFSRVNLSSTALAARRSAELAEEKRKARESEIEQGSDPNAEAA